MLNVQKKKEEEKGFVELNKIMILDEFEEDVYWLILMFCEILKFFKVVDLKEILMELFLWVLLN